MFNLWWVKPSITLSISLSSFFFLMLKSIPFMVSLHLYRNKTIVRSAFRLPPHITRTLQTIQISRLKTRTKHHLPLIRTCRHSFFFSYYCTFYIYVFKLHLERWMCQILNLYQNEETYGHSHLVKDEMPVIQLQKNTWLERRCSPYEKTLCLIFSLLSGDQ